jgi:two-component system chemotaxis response regulator CheY
MKSCLLVDDSKAIRAIVRPILANLGFEVLEAGDGAEALKICQAEFPTAVLLDWNMPVMNGLEFVKAVRAEQGLRDVTLMMVTTEAEHGQIVRALAAGAHEYLIKPFTSDALVDKLDYLGLNPQRSVA